MTPERIRSIVDCGVCIDFETDLVQKGLLIPPLVCGAVARVVDVGEGRRGIRGRILTADEAVAAIIAVLEDPNAILVNLNVAYDLAVAVREAALRGRDIFPLVFEAYANGRVYDPGIAEQLHAIAEGHLLGDPRTGGKLADPYTGEQKVGYRLSVVTDLVLGRINAKANDRWRESYALLRDIPMEQWPPEARQYPVDDVCNALEIALAQIGAIPNVGAHKWGANMTCARCGANRGQGGCPASCTSTYPRRNLHDLARQCYAAWALHLGACWGFRTDPVATEFLARVVAEERSAGLPPFLEAGFIREADADDEDAKNSKDTAVLMRAVALAYGCGGVCPDADPARPYVTCTDGKVWNKFSKKDAAKPVGKPKNCKRCNGTGLNLESASVPRTDPTATNPFGQVKCGRDVLTESGDELLMAFGQFGENDKLPSTYLPDIREGFTVPWTQRPNVLLDTGRSSYSGTAQLMPREIAPRLRRALKLRREADPSLPLVIGVRDCVIARPGTAFFSVDFSGGELVTHAQNCKNLVGFSHMGDALNKGLDVHAALGATMTGVDFEEFWRRYKEKDRQTKLVRQASKPPNFGFPGGMGAWRLVLQQREQGPDTPCANGPSLIYDETTGEFVHGYKGLRFCVLVDGAAACGVVKVTEWKKREGPPTCRHCIEVAERLRVAWFQNWPENKLYLNGPESPVNRAIERGEQVHHWSGRVRGVTDFCSAANGWFQGFLGDITKEALCRVSYEMYVRGARVRSREPGRLSQFEGCESPLYGSRLIAAIHDEGFGEAPESVASEAADRVSEVFVETFREACPDFKAACKAPPALSRRWYKSMETLRGADGRLIPWEPS